MPAVFRGPFVSCQQPQFVRGLGFVETGAQRCVDITECCQVLDLFADRVWQPHFLIFNQVRQHNLQVINDARQNKAQIKVTPTGGRASYEAAQVFSGIIRRIEYQSKAVDAYSTATYHQVESGIGYVRVETDYVDNDSFDLDLFIRRIPDPRSIYMDPDCKLYDKSDANFAFVFEDVPRDRYEEEYGKDTTPRRPRSTIPTAGTTAITFGLRNTGGATSTA
jgi:hypothetical protein